MCLYNILSHITITLLINYNCMLSLPIIKIYISPMHIICITMVLLWCSPKREKDLHGTCYRVHGLKRQVQWMQLVNLLANQEILNISGTVFIARIK